MPIYERRCNDSACNKVAQVLRKVETRAYPFSCPTCGEETHPIMSATRTNFTFADPSPIKGPKRYRGRQAQYIKDQHGLTPDGE